MKEISMPELKLEQASDKEVQKLDVCNVGAVNNAGDLFQYKCRQGTNRAHAPYNETNPHGEDGATDRAQDRTAGPAGAPQDEREREREGRGKGGATDRAPDMNDCPELPKDTAPDVLERDSEDGATDRAHDMNEPPEGPEGTLEDEERELDWRDEPEYREEEHGDRIEETGEVISRERKLDVLKEDAEHDEAIRRVLERERMESQRGHAKTIEQVPVDSTGFPISE